MAKGKQGVLWIPVSEVNGYGIPPLLLNDCETRAAFPMLPAAVPASQHGLGGENTGRGMAYLQGGNGENITQEPVRYFPWVPGCCRYTLPLWGMELGSSHPGLCAHTVSCQMAAPIGQVSSFFDMCLYAGDAFSFLKISFLARRRKGKTISKK